MSFDLEKILQSKRAFRQRLAARPIEEKLAMLEALRERQLAIQGGAARAGTDSSVLREESVTYGVKAGKDQS